MLLGDRMIETQPSAWYALEPRGRLFESIRWIPDADVFQWVDILAGRVYRWNPIAGADPSYRQLDLEFATAALPIDSERSVVASRSSLHLLTWSSGALETLGSWKFEPDIRFNDGAIAPDGSVHIGTMSMERRPAAGALWRFSDGELEPILKDIGISNGLAWINATSAVYVDSLQPQVDLLTFSGTVVERRKLCSLGPDAEPDGLFALPSGEVLAALWGGSALALIPPHAETVARVRLPVKYPSSVCVGGVENDLIAVTSASIPADSTSMDGHVIFTRLSAEPS